MNTDRFKIITTNDLEDYRDRAGDLSETCWPEFMLHDDIANKNWHDSLTDSANTSLPCWTRKPIAWQPWVTAYPFTGIRTSPSFQKAAGIGSFCKPSIITKIRLLPPSNLRFRSPSIPITRVRV